MSSSKTAGRGRARRSRGKRRRPTPGASGTRRRINVREALDLHLVGEPSQEECWVHTHGMEGFGLPELEIRAVMPRYLMPGAADLLMDIADYMLNSGKTVRADEEMSLGRLARVRFAKGSPADGGDPAHYSCERWAVLDVAEKCCPFCEERAAGCAGDEAAGGLGRLN